MRAKLVRIGNSRGVRLPKAMIDEAGLGLMGAAKAKARLHVVVSPDELNELQSTYILAPLTTGRAASRSRLSVQFGGRKGLVVLDRLGTASAEQIVKPIGKLSPSALESLLTILREVFAE